MKRKIMIIGCGGIGSYLIPLLDKTGLYEITVFDPDTVERKNLTYQNFVAADVGKTKVISMFSRFKSIKRGEPFPVLTNKQMDGYDLVICCADNLDIRKTLYNSEINWLDLRAQGRNGAILSYQEDKNKLAGLLSGPDGSFSCQGTSWDGGEANLHFTHVGVAGLGAEWIQRWFNKEDTFKHKLVGI